MQFLKLHYAEIILNYRYKEYRVSRYFVIFNYNLHRLEYPIICITKDGYLENDFIQLKNRPIGLFRFDCVEMDILTYHNSYLNSSLRFGDFFDSDTHFFVLVS